MNSISNWSTNDSLPLQTIRNFKKIGEMRYTKELKIRTWMVSFHVNFKFTVTEKGLIAIFTGVA